LSFIYDLDTFSTGISGRLDLEMIRRILWYEGKAVAGLEGDKKSFNTGWGRIWDNKWVASWWKSNVWYMGDVPALWYYYDRIGDRGIHGLENTHSQYVGLKPLKLWKITTSNLENVWNRIKDLNDVDQYATKTGYTGTW